MNKNRITDRQIQYILEDTETGKIFRMTKFAYENYYKRNYDDSDIKIVEEVDFSKKEAAPTKPKRTRRRTTKSEESNTTTKKESSKKETNTKSETPSPKEIKTESAPVENKDPFSIPKLDGDKKPKATKTVELEKPNVHPSDKNKS